MLGHNIHHLGMRRQSAAKIHSLSVEAPITKVINIILAAQENSPQYIAQALDKVSFPGCVCRKFLSHLPSLQVLDILQTTDSINLFSPEVERERKKHTDAVTTDLLGALLSVSWGCVSTRTFLTNESCPTDMAGTADRFCSDGQTWFVVQVSQRLGIGHV